MDQTLDPNYPEAVVTDVRDRYGCLFVTGKVLKAGSWIDASLVVPKSDIDHMTRDELLGPHGYLVRRLPQFTVDVDWMSEVLAV